jgi:hypothetical protein
VDRFRERLRPPAFTLVVSGCVKVFRTDQDCTDCIGDVVKVVFIVDVMTEDESLCFCVVVKGEDVVVVVSMVLLPVLCNRRVRRSEAFCFRMVQLAPLDGQLAMTRPKNDGVVVPHEYDETTTKFCVIIIIDINRKGKRRRKKE